MIHSESLEVTRTAFENEFLQGWFGSWVVDPQTDRDRAASSLVRQKVTFTEAGSVIMPVAIAAIDILGMKALLEAKDLSAIARLVAEPFYDLNGPLYRLGHLNVDEQVLRDEGFRPIAQTFCAFVSDTILLVQRPHWEHGNHEIACAEAIVSLAQYVAKMTKINSAYSVPLRSAIAFGDCLVSVGGQLALLGAPTREASEWEKCQEWAGGMLTPSAIDILKRAAKEAKGINGANFEVHYPDWLVPYDIPVKESAVGQLPRPSIALNWVNATIPGGTLFFEARLPEVGADAREDVRQKVKNTIKFSEYCQSHPSLTSRDF